ncbi:MAG TPA: FtsQ-type POTRA domain-containing protein [Vicinamibacterales bacterium]
MGGRRLFAAVCTVVWASWASTGVLAQQDVIAEIHVHGNTVTSTEDILRLSGLTVGDPFREDQLAQAANRLRATNTFEHVEVLKRYASIDDLTRIAIVLLVDEGPVRIVLEEGGAGQATRVLRGRVWNFMFMPMLSSEDGYGLTYGARFSLVDAAGRQSRISFPLTWGGDKAAAIELEKTFSARGAPRLTGGALLQRRTHPYYEEDADRSRIWARADWQIGRPVRAGAIGGWQEVSFLGDQAATPLIGGDVSFDTRLDPMLPRNAIYARAAVEHFRLPDLPLTRTELDGRGYIGIGGQRVLVLRGLHETTNRAAPPYYQSILGGDRNLRGFKAGTAVGDTLVAASAELRAPLTSPLRIAKLGINVFVDTGVAYDKGLRLRDQTFQTGTGAGVWLAAALVHLHLEVAHGFDAGTRAHFGMGFTF